MPNILFYLIYMLSISVCSLNLDFIEYFVIHRSSRSTAPTVLAENRVLL